MNTKLRLATLAAGALGGIALAGSALADFIPTLAGTHFAVWLLKLSVGGQTITVPIYVDPTTGTQTGLGAYRMLACFSAPDTPMGSPNHAPFGAQLLDANFTVDSAITLPASSGTYV